MTLTAPGFDLRATATGTTNRYSQDRRSAEPQAALTAEKMRPATQTWELEPSDFAPPWMQLMIRDLNRLATLPAGWDSYGGRPLEQKATDYAFNLLDHMNFGGPAPWVSPTPDGGLHMEWSRSDVTVEVDVEVDTTVAVVVTDHGTVDEWETSIFGDERLQDALRRVATAH